MSNFFEKFLKWVKGGLSSVKEVKSGQATSDVENTYRIGKNLFVKIRYVPGNLTIEAFSTLKRLRVFPNGGPHFFKYEASEKRCTHSNGKRYYGLEWTYSTNEPKKYTQCVVHWLLENFNDGWHGTGASAGSNSYARYREPERDVQVPDGAGGAGSAVRVRERDIQRIIIQVPDGTGADRRMQIDYLLNPVNPIYPIERSPKRLRVMVGQV